MLCPASLHDGRLCNATSRLGVANQRELFNPEGTQDTGPTVRLYLQSTVIGYKCQTPSSGLSLAASRRILDQLIQLKADESDLKPDMSASVCRCSVCVG